MKDAFAHHLWATERILDACARLDAPQLGTLVPGTERSILDTVRHLVAGDAVYLLWLTQDRAVDIDTKDLDVAALRSAMRRNADAWSELLSVVPDLDTPVTDIDPAGYRRTASIGIRLAQALHHGSDHRGQISSALTVIGIEPPGLDVWDYGNETGRVVDVPPAS